MDKTVEYALLSLYVYDVQLKPENKPQLPDGWTPIELHNDGVDGFSYGLFRHTGGEITLAYTGSNQGIDWWSNGTAGTGLLTAPQVYLAALAYCMAVRNYGPNITLTGHSLGGGLASIVAEWFNRPAVVFDEGPFELTARDTSIFENVKKALQDSALNVEEMTGALINYASREARITNYYIMGEFLSFIRGSETAVMGRNIPIALNAGPASIFQLHSMALLTAAKLSEKFLLGTYSSSEVVSLVMDKKLYGFETDNSSERNFLIDLIRSDQSLKGQGKLTHFGKDLLKLKGAKLDGMSLEAQRMILAQAIEWYYLQPKSYSGKEFASTIGNLIQYTTARGAALAGVQDKTTDYIEKWKSTILVSEGLIIGNTNQFEQWNVNTGTKAVLGGALDKKKTQLYLGNDGDDKFLSGNRDDVLLGEKGNDILIGGFGNDRILGGDDDDLLVGDSMESRSGGGLVVNPNVTLDAMVPGMDTLEGGEGFDRYLMKGNFGTDYIKDSDGQGGVQWESNRLVGGFREANSTGSLVYKRDIGALGIFIYELKDVDTGGVGTLIITKEGDLSNKIVVNNFKNNDLGISLVEEDHVFGDGGLFGESLYGDMRPSKTLYVPGPAPFQTTGGHLRYLWEDTLRVAEPDFKDVLKGTDANSEIFGYGGDDVLDGRAGNDFIDGGNGRDLLTGGAGADYLQGGDGDDALSGDGYTFSSIDLHYGPDPQNTYGPGVSTAWNIYFESTTDTYRTSGFRDVSNKPSIGGGDFLSGDGGNDFILGSFDSDIIDGGADNDVIFGSYGNDFIMGGDGNDVILAYGQLNDNDVLDTSYLSAEEIGSAFIQGGAGGDTIYGYSGGDNIFGDEGGDILYGQSGNDNISAGADDDQMRGDGGDDTLAGDAGNDLIKGDVEELYLPVNEHGNDNLSGGTGLDTLVGGGGNDQLFGGTENDTLWGDDSASDLRASAHGNDYLDGQEGDDFLIGGGGSDELMGGEDDDILWGDEQQDSTTSNNGNDTLNGGGGNDTLRGGGGNDLLVAGEGDDTLLGGDGDDTLIGSGIDILQGGAGNDTYEYDSETLPDLQGGVYNLFDNEGVNHIKISGVASITGANVNGLDVKINFNNNGSLILSNAFVGEKGGGNVLAIGGESVIINDWLLKNLTVSIDNKSNHDNVYLTGGARSDFLSTGSYLGNLLNAGGGDDSYQMNKHNENGIQLKKGDGLDSLASIVNTGATESNADLSKANYIQFTDDTNINDLRVLHYVNGEYENVLMYGEGDGLALLDKLVKTGGPIDEIRFNDGTGISWEYLISKGIEVVGTTADMVQRGTAFNDTFIFYSTNEKVAGLSGDDTFIFGLGDGEDTILSDERGRSDQDVVRFKQNVQQQDVVFIRDGNDLLIRFKSDTKSSLSIYNAFVDSPLSKIQFSNGDFYNFNELPLGQSNDFATNNSDSLIGMQGADVINGFAGNDLIEGRGGNDYLEGDEGADQLFGGEGQDTLIGEQGDDTISGGSGSDTYVYRVGDGKDVILAKQDATDDANVLLLKGGILPSEVKFFANGNDLRVVLSETDEININSFFNPTKRAIDAINFDDGTTYGVEKVLGALFGTASLPSSFTVKQAVNKDDWIGLTTPRNGYNSNRLLVNTLSTSLFGDYYYELHDQVIVGLTDGPTEIDSTANFMVGSDGKMHPSNGNYLIGGSKGDQLSGGAFAYGGGGNDTLSAALQMDGGAGDDVLTLGDGINGVTAVIFGGEGSGIDTIANATTGRGIRRFADIQVKGGFNASQVSAYVTPSGHAVLKLNDRDMLSIESLENVSSISFADTVWTGATIASHFQNTNVQTDAITLNLAEGQTFSIDPFAGVAQKGYTGEPIVAYRINQPDNQFILNWLNIDTATGRLSGSYPLLNDGETVAQDALHTIEMIDRNGLSVIRPLVLNVQTQHVAPKVLTPLPDLVIEPGETFSIDVKPYFQVERGGVTYSRSPSATWIQSSATINEYRIFGTAPTGTNTNYNITVTLRDSSNLAVSDVFNLKVAPVTVKLTGTSGADTLAGSYKAETLSGGLGDDSLNGGRGLDTLIGGGGNDTYRVESPDEDVRELAGTAEGTADTVLIDYTPGTEGGGYVLPDNIENITIVNDASTTTQGNSSSNKIVGNTLSNSLDGGLGNDTLEGGLGNDFYQVDSSLDQIIEASGGGYDYVYATSTSYTLSAYVDELEFGYEVVGHVTGVGSEQANKINATTNQISDADLRGLGGNDTLMGSSGNDTLDGGAGQDVLMGGAGDDIYVVDDASDQVVEWDGVGVYGYNPGYDTIRSSVSYRLSDGIEKLEFTGTAALKGYGTANSDWLVGNEGVNELHGHSAGDQLDGRGGNDQLYGEDGDDTLNGGIGADAMNGGSGDDVFYVDNLGDQVIEASNAGSDAVYASIDHQLSVNVENLVLQEMAVAINGTGNATANILRGNSLSNLLSGLAGNDMLLGQAGADTLLGGVGDDQLEGGVGGDVYRINLGDGLDHIREDDETAGATDTIEFANITSANIRSLERHGDDLQINYGAVDQVTVLNHFSDQNAQIERIQFSDGETWAQSAIQSMVITMGDAMGNTIFSSPNLQNKIQGLQGRDYLIGSTLADTLYGGTDNDTLIGGAGDDWLLGESGNDSMVGVDGDDLYTVDSSGDVVVEAADYSAVTEDSVFANVDYVLPSNVEYLILEGTDNLQAWSNADGGNLIGNDGNNYLHGDAFWDTLNGGAGSDVLAGGLDDDTYILEDAQDVIIEAADEGYDTIWSYTSESLVMADNVEEIVHKLTGPAFLGLDVTGNALDNKITGSTGTHDKMTGGAGNDSIYGLGGQDTIRGGLGNDFLSGGAGGDSYYFSRGDGQDRIAEIQKLAAGTQNTLVDKLLFEGNVLSSQLWFIKNDKDLFISVIGTQDSTTVKNWYQVTANYDYKIEQIKAAGDNKTLLSTKVDQLVQAMAGMTPPPLGQTTLTAAQQQALAPALAAAWA